MAEDREPTKVHDPVALAVAAAHRLDIRFDSAELLRQATSSHVLLRGAGIVARVEPVSLGANAARQVFAARLLEARGVPAARLARVQSQPVVLPDGFVTLWRELDLIDRAPDVTTLAELSRRLHDTTRDSLPVDTPPLDPFADTRVYLASAERQSGLAGVEKLRPRLERLARRWPTLCRQDPFGQALVHGDLHRDNVVITPEGPVLIDLENAGRGPVSWDLLPPLVAARRYGAPEADVEAFFAAYGESIPDWEGIEDLCRIYELFLGSWAIACSDRSPALAREAPIRLRTLLGEADDAWTIL